MALLLQTSAHLYIKWQHHCLPRNYLRMAMGIQELIFLQTQECLSSDAQHLGSVEMIAYIA